MKRIYIVQPTFMNTNSIYLPYAAGALISYAWSFREIKENYEFINCFFLRENPDVVLDKIEDPFLIGFSCYMWNFEYNKVLAEKIKSRYPGCIIVFGGQHISPDSSDLNAYPFIDFLIHGEGEIAFKKLLDFFVKGNEIEKVPNISYRGTTEIINNQVQYSDVLDFPSPYQSGFFDAILKEYPDLDFIPLIETNRGCPNRCTYCSWGQNKAKVRLFPIERVMFDINWVSERRMDFLGFADANFGIVPRDEEIVSRIIELKEKNGFPKKFQVSYAKDSYERVYRITKKLNEYGMDKGVTLSFQSMSQAVQNNIGRSNMYIEKYKQLLKKYADESIPTYTDLILGLPGETFESFKEGFEKLLECGQHTSLFVHLCEWLPRAEMAEKEYMKKFDIKYKKLPLNQPHSSKNKNDGITEYSRLIVQTNTMSSDDWIKMIMFSTSILCFHHLGLMKMIGLFVHDKAKIKYTDFYSELLHFMITESSDELNTFGLINEEAHKLIHGSGSAVICDNRFGNIMWPYEEYAFLDLVSKYRLFFSFIKGFLKKYIDDCDVIDELIEYQIFVLKKPSDNNCSFLGNYDWKYYFDSLLKNKKGELIKKKTEYVIKCDYANYSMPEYAKKILWFGRRGGKNLFSSEIEVVC